MSELLNKLFHGPNMSLQSINHKINQFCNYLVLNLSIHSRYLNEIGVHKTEKNIVLTVYTAMSNRTSFETDFQNLLKPNSLAKEYLSLQSEGYNVTTAISARPFAEKFIEKLSHYYFIPRRTKNRYLFKYCSLNENLITLLTNNTLWFSDPASFNDPFDCRYSIDSDPTELEVIKFYYTKDNTIAMNIPFDHYANDFRMPPKEQFLKDLEEHHFINSFSKKQGVCCLTEKYDNKLMWAHYAQNFTGLCLVFDISKDVEDGYFQFSGDKVRYRSSMVRKFYDGSPYFEVTDILYSKSKTWSYECEIREHFVFEKGQTDRAVPFDPQCLVGIILGARMDEKDQASIKSLTSQLTKYNIEYINSEIDLRNNCIRLAENSLSLR